MSRRILRLAFLTAAFGAASASPALAYIGPGVGFAAAGSVLVLVGTFALAIGIVLLWPLKAVVRLATNRNPNKPKVKRCIVVGLDGFDPGLAKRFSAEGLMPNFAKLAEEGCFSELQTAMPSISPVAWSSFATGVDASRHNIYDFLTRDPCSYMPTLSSSDIAHAAEDVEPRLRAKVPFARRRSSRSCQKSQPFWKLLGANANVWSSIIRVCRSRSRRRSSRTARCSPECAFPTCKGTQGSFSFYSTKVAPPGELTSAASSITDRAQGPRRVER